MSKDLFNPMPAHGDDQSASYVQGTIQRDAPRAVRKGADPAHPELADAHPDNVKLKVQAAELPGGGFTAVGHDANRVLGPMQDHAPEAFAPSATLRLREKRN